MSYPVSTALAAAVRPIIDLLETRALMHATFDATIDFQVSQSDGGDGTYVDAGLTYRTQPGGLAYGWSSDATSSARNRNSPLSPTEAHDTVNYLNFESKARAWEIALPDGAYLVRVTSGDANYTGRSVNIAAEGRSVVTGTTTADQRWLNGATLVEVTDGKLTLTAAAGTQSPISFVTIEATHANLVSVAKAADASEAGPKAGAFTFTRQGNLDNELIVPIDIAGSATPGVDYASLTPYVTFAAGSATATIAVIPLTDGLADGVKDVSVTIADDDNYETGAAAATLSIADADSAGVTAVETKRIAFQPSSVAIPSGFRADYGDTFAARGFGLRYGWTADARPSARDRGTAPSSSAQQPYDGVNYLNFAGASRNWEFELPNGRYTVRIVSGDATNTGRTVDIKAEGVRVISGTTTSARKWLDETFTVDITDGRLTLTNTNAAVNNPINFIEVTPAGDAPVLPQVTLGVTDATAKEDTTDTGRFVITRTGSTAAALVVRYTMSGSATNGIDYDSLVGSVTIPAGASSAALPVNPIDDTAVEGSETVTLTIDASSAYARGAATFGTVTIADNDAVGTLSWKTVASSPVGHSENFGGNLGGKLYSFGGYINSTYVATPRVDRYDPATNKWTRMNDLPAGMTHVATAVDGMSMYLVGGYPVVNGRQTFATNKVYRYDSNTDTYTALPNLPVARGGGAAAKVGNALFYMGGSDSARKDAKDVWVLDLTQPALGWKARPALPEARNHPAAIGANGKVYFFGGQTGQDLAANHKANVYIFDPVTEVWSAGANMINGGRSHMTSSAFLYAGKVFLLAGESDSAVLRNVESYDLATNTWQSYANLPAARIAGVADVINGKFYFNGGYNGKFEATTFAGTFT